MCGSVKTLNTSPVGLCKLTLLFLQKLRVFTTQPIIAAYLIIRA